MDKRGPIYTKWTKLDRIGPKWTEVDLIEPNGIKVGLIGPNGICLIFREKSSSTNFREQIIHYITITKIIIYSHALRGSTTSD